jgi:hypothetical protein
MTIRITERKSQPTVQSGSFAGSALPVSPPGPVTSVNWLRRMSDQLPSPLKEPSAPLVIVGSTSALALCSPLFARMTWPWPE